MRKRALVVMGEGYGNVVMATPVVEAMHRFGCATDVLVESHHRDAATLLAGWEVVASLFTTRRTFLRHGMRPYDAVVRTVWSRGGPLRCGPEVSPDPLPRDRHHEMMINMTAARAAGYRGSIPPPHVEGDTPFWPLPSRYAVIAPGYGGKRRSDWTRKHWPHWRRLCIALHREFGLDVVALGAEADELRWMQRAQFPWLRPLFGRTSIRGAVGILRRAEVCVAVDNGLAHIAGALDTPTVALFGATSEVKNRPLGPRVRVIAADLHCRPCQMTDRWDACKDWRCMQLIGTGRVMETIREMEVQPCA